VAVWYALDRYERTMRASSSSSPRSEISFPAPAAVAAALTTSHVAVKGSKAAAAVDDDGGAAGEGPRRPTAAGSTVKIATWQHSFLYPPERNPPNRTACRSLIGVSVAPYASCSG
jgi:hypothetical protein